MKTCVAIGIEMGMQARIRSGLIIFGSFYLHNISMGLASSFGVIYKELVIVFEVGEGSIGWIPSLFTGLLLGAGKKHYAYCHFNGRY